MLHVIDLVKECDDGRETTPTERLVWGAQVIAIHRIWFDDWKFGETHEALEIARRFTDDPAIAKHTGGEIPYTFLIDKGGVVHQCLKLGDLGRHARAWNTVAMGIGMIGDFRIHSATPRQRLALVTLCAELCVAHAIDPTTEAHVILGNGSRHKVMGVSGHDELPGGSHDAHKVCPGKWLQMHELRFEIARTILAMGRERVLRAGIVI